MAATADDSRDAGRESLIEGALLLTEDEYRSWIADHHVAPSAADDLAPMACASATLGKPPRAALLCEGGATMPVPISSPDGYSAFALVVALLDGSKIRRVQKIPIATGPLDPIPVPGLRAHDVELTAHLDPTGMILSIRGSIEQHECAEAASRHRDMPLHLPAIRAMCASGVSGNSTAESSCTKRVPSS